MKIKYKNIIPVVLLVITIVIINFFFIWKNSASNEQVIEENLENSGDDFESFDTDNLEESKKEDELVDVSCYITGEVATPGLVKIKNGKRLADAVEILGGLTKDADINRINLAMKVKDECHYVIPSINDKENESNSQVGNSDVNQPESGDLSSSNVSGQGGKININSASEAELINLPGVGPSTAKKIINHREKNGGFKTIDGLKDVSGIGEKKFEAVKDLIEV